MSNGSLGTMLYTCITQNTTFIRTTTPQLEEKRLQSTQFVPRMRYTKGIHHASLCLVPLHSKALGSTKRGWHHRTIRQWRYTTKRLNQWEEKPSPKQQTIKKPRGRSSKGPQRNLRNGFPNNSTSLQFIGKFSSTSEELMRS